MLTDAALLGLAESVLGRLGSEDVLHPEDVRLALRGKLSGRARVVSICRGRGWVERDGARVVVQLRYGGAGPFDGPLTGYAVRGLASDSEAVWWRRFAAAERSARARAPRGPLSA